jgi:dihydroorotase
LPSFLRSKKRGYIREGCYADLALVDLESPWTAAPDNILSKYGWPLFESQTCNSKVTHTIESGHLAYEKCTFHDEEKGMRLKFSRKYKA